MVNQQVSMQGNNSTLVYVHYVSNQEHVKGSLFVCDHINCVAGISLYSIFHYSFSVV